VPEWVKRFVHVIPPSLVPKIDASGPFATKP
jgi:hypothetical protein